MKNRLRTLLVDAIDLFVLSVRVNPVTRSAEAKAATSGSHARSREISLMETSNPTRRTVERVSSREAVLSDGRTKRCLYLLDSCCVDDPYS